MTIFICEETFGAMMTCVYDAWASRLGHANVRLQTEPVRQRELFCDYVCVQEDIQKAEKVTRAIVRKISREAYRQVYLAAMSFEEDRLDAIYRFLILGFANGKKVTDMLFRRPVMRLLELSRKTGNEANFFREFTRFSSADGKVYVAYIEPKCNVAGISAEHFADRMPSENWMLIDGRRKLAAVHPADEPFYMTRLSDAELRNLKRLEGKKDLYTDLWQEFFRSTGIKERENKDCQRNLLPLWYRKHITEFQETPILNV